MVTIPEVLDSICLPLTCRNWTSATPTVELESAASARLRDLSVFVKHLGLLLYTQGSGTTDAYVEAMEAMILGV
jgi:hypothetical protein